MWAARDGRKETLELLLEQENIDINAKENNGLTALISAGGGGHKDIVELLLEQESIDIDSKNDLELLLV